MICFAIASPLLTKHNFMNVRMPSLAIVEGDTRYLSEKVKEAKMSSDPLTIAVATLIQIPGW